MAESKKEKSSKPKRKRRKKKVAPAAEKMTGAPGTTPPPPPVHELRDLQVTSIQLTKERVQGGGYVCDPPPEEEASPQDRLAGLFGKGATDLELDLDVARKATPGPWEVSSGYEQSDPGTFIAGNGLIVAAEQDGTDCVLREEDAVFMARARNRWPDLIDAAVELHFGFAELVRRYREWADMKTCIPSVREILRRISADIENQVSRFECERTGPSFVAQLGIEQEQLKKEIRQLEERNATQAENNRVLQGELERGQERVAKLEGERTPPKDKVAAERRRHLRRIASAALEQVDQLAGPLQEAVEDFEAFIDSRRTVRGT